VIEQQTGPPESEAPAPEGTGTHDDRHVDSTQNIGSEQVSWWDCRGIAPATETGLDPIDQAMTFTGLAANMRECADRVGRVS
jgi:hypothetical protein